MVHTISEWLRRSRWKRQLWCAQKLGWYRYKGIWSMAPDNFPKGQILYTDGLWSAPMSLGGAVDYAKMFGGTVHPVQHPRASDNGQR
jgi:hypothetical protein